MYDDALLVHLRQLREVKFRLASRAFFRHYDAWRNGRDEESKVIRTGALQELDELLRIDAWITSLGGPACRLAGFDEASAEPPVDELGERCRMVKLVQQRLPAPGCEAVARRLRAFLAELAAEEAARLNALLSCRAALSC